jgi:hypothetical protein
MWQPVLWWEFTTEKDLEAKINLKKIFLQVKPFQNEMIHCISDLSWHFKKQTWCKFSHFWRSTTFLMQYSLKYSAIILSNIILE